MKIITTVMKSCIAVMKNMTARDEQIHYGGYNFMPSRKSIFRMEHPRTTKAVVVEVTACDRMSSQGRPRQQRHRPRSRTAMQMYPLMIVTRHPSAIREVDMTPGNLRQDPDLVRGQVQNDNKVALDATPSFVSDDTR